MFSIQNFLFFATYYGEGEEREVWLVLLNKRGENWKIYEKSKKVASKS